MLANLDAVIHALEALTGALIGYVLPLVSAIQEAVNVMDMVVWGLVALVVQLAVYFAVRAMREVGTFVVFLSSAMGTLGIRDARWGVSRYRPVVE